MRQSEDLQGIADGGQWIAKLMGQSRQKLILASIGLRLALGQCPQIILELPPFGDILANGRQRQRLPGCIRNG